MQKRRAVAGPMALVALMALMVELWTCNGQEVRRFRRQRHQEAP